MTAVETYRRRPTTVEMLLWDGTKERADQIREWVGVIPDDEHLWACMITAGKDGSLWNSQEMCWIPLPIGHRVVRGALGEFHPISAEALARTYELVAE